MDHDLDKPVFDQAHKLRRMAAEAKQATLGKCLDSGKRVRALTKEAPLVESIKQALAEEAE